MGCVYHSKINKSEGENGGGLVAHTEQYEKSVCKKPGYFVVCGIIHLRIVQIIRDRDQ